MVAACFFKLLSKTAFCFSVYDLMLNIHNFIKNSIMSNNLNRFAAVLLLQSGYFSAFSLYI
ncbi:MAG TPA: hypothetical protein DCP97_01230, partial [Ruminococcaceae bacterium]|nr:hypothetical protein [Oscillospiraceae bacterium]